MRPLLVALGVASLGIGSLVSLGVLSLGIDSLWSVNPPALAQQGGFAGHTTPDQFYIHLQQQQQQQQEQQQQQRQTDLARGEVGASGDGVKDEAGPVRCQQQSKPAAELGKTPMGSQIGPVYYQQGLAQHLLQHQGIKISPYNPNLVYHSLAADGKVLREYLQRMGMNVPPADSYR